MTVGESRKKHHEHIAVQAHLTLVLGQLYLATGLVDETAGRKLLQLNLAHHAIVYMLSESLLQHLPEQLLALHPAYRRQQFRHQRQADHEIQE